MVSFVWKLEIGVVSGWRTVAAIGCEVHREILLPLGSQKAVFTFIPVQHNLQRSLCLLHSWFLWSIYTKENTAVSLWGVRNVSGLVRKALKVLCSLSTSVVMWIVISSNWMAPVRKLLSSFTSSVGFSGGLLALALTLFLDSSQIISVNFNMWYFIW